MDFLAPLMLLGVAGALVPIGVHLIGRRRAPVVGFAALDFLLGSDRKVARRLRLRERLLLATRVLACLAIPLALAKPYTSCAARGPLVERGPQAVALVIDDSLIGRYHLGDSSLVAEARRRAAALLDQIGPEAEVAVVLTSEGSHPPTELSRDHLRLRDQIERIVASNRPADTTLALRRAAQLLATSVHEHRRIYLLSPLAATGLRADEPPWPPGTGPAVTVIDLTAGAALSNVAVTDAKVEADPTASSRGILVTAELTNYGSEPVEERGISLRVGERVVARGRFSLLPGESQSKRFSAVLPPPGRLGDVVVEIDHDRLPIDDVRYVRAELRDEVRVLLVNGDPRTVRHDDELFYLETALRPGDRGDSGTAVATATADDLERIRLADLDVVVLANVRALPAERVTQLAAWVQAGGGLWITVGDKVDPDAYDMTMTPLLPQSLRDAVDAVYGARGEERRGRALRLAKLTADHPIFTAFSREAAGLREATFERVMLTGPTTRVDERSVLARYSSGAAALIEGKLGAGRLLLYTSTIDRDWNDLPIHPGYLPLVQESVRYLAHKQDSRPAGADLVGGNHRLSVRPDDTRLEISGPGDIHAVIEGDRLDGRKQVGFSGADEPGFYRVASVGKSGASIDRPEAGFAVNLDPRGSDVRRAPAGLVSRTGADEPAAAAARHRRVELWHALGAALLLLLLSESLLVQR